MAVTGARIIPRRLLLVLALAAVIGLVAFQLLRPLPVVAATTAPAPTAVPGAPPTLPWPAKGEASVGTAELGLLGVSRFAELDRSYLHAAVPTSVPHVLSAFPLLKIEDYRY